MTEQSAAAPSSSRRLLNATAVMAAGTLISRILGFVKAALLVIVLGATTPQADAYSLATVVPNSLYMLLAGGALNTVLVPQIVRHIKNDDDNGEAFIDRIVTAFLIVLLAATALAMLFAPQIIGLWTNERWQGPEMAGHWQQLAFMGLLTMPQLFFYGAFFLVGQVLNARDKFGPMMWAPILNNLVAIAVLGLYVVMWGTSIDAGVPFSDEQVLMLGLGSTLGIVVQTLALIPSMRAIGFRYRPRFDLKGQGLGETFHLAKWMLGYVLLTTLVQIVVANLATGATGDTSSTPGAGLTTYNTAYLVWILPHSLLTVSLATAMLPSASRLAAAHDLEGVAAETLHTVRMALTFLVPSSVAFLVLGLPFARLAFGHGANTEGWVYIGWTLMALALGLIPFTIQYIYLRGFYALEDTRSVFFLQVWISLLNVALAFLLVSLDPNPMTVAPRLAVAYVLSYVLGAWLTYRSLGWHLPSLRGGEVVRHVAQLLFSVAPGAIAAVLITWWTLDKGFLVVAAGFLGSIVVAVVSFFVLARRLGIQETSQLLNVLRRRGGRAADEGAPVRGEEAVGALDDDVPDPGTGARPQGFMNNRGSDAAGSTGAGSGEGAVLAYPDPRTEARTPTPTPPSLLTDLEPGEVLGGRYRLDQALSRRGVTVTWRGWDLNLSRPVLLHVLDRHEPRALEILDQARQAAPAVDTRFLRVWDTVLDETGRNGSFIVCEYAPGQSLELALAQGPLSDVEAAWIVREVASALAGTHAQGLYHRQLNPDTVVLTASGNVKIVGFLVEHALHPEGSASDPEKADVQALGEILYASLTGRWPGPARYGLPAAPTDAHGRPVAARKVSTRVSQELSDIVDRILSPTPHGRSTRLESAADIAAALGALLSGADASHLLDQRLRYPVDPIRITAPKAVRPGPEMTPLAALERRERLSEPLGDETVQSEPFALSEEIPVVGPDADGDPGGMTGTAVASGAHLAADQFVEDSQPTQLSDPFAEPSGPLQGRPDALPASPWGRPLSEDEGATERYFIDDDDEDDIGTAPFTPIPPPKPDFSVTQQAPTEDPPRRGMVILVGIFVLVLLASLIGVFVNQFNKMRSTPPQPGTPFAITATKDFDPKRDGGDDAENGDLTQFVADGDPNTRWTTERYGKSPNFNARKPGAGVLVDLGEKKKVGWVVLNLGTGPTAGEIRVPNNTDSTLAPMESRNDWRTVTTFQPSTGEVRLQLGKPIETRFVLVYLTDLPKEGPNYVGAIHEVTVTG